MFGLIKNFSSLFKSAHLKVGFYEDFLQVNFDHLRESAASSDVWAILTNPLIIALSVILLIWFAVKRSRKAITLLGAVWSYGFIYHFTLGLHKQETDPLAGKQVVDFAPLIGFFGGMILVTIVVLYVVFKSD